MASFCTFTFQRILFIIEAFNKIIVVLPNKHKVEWKSTSDTVTFEMVTKALFQKNVFTGSQKLVFKEKSILYKSNVRTHGCVLLYFRPCILTKTELSIIEINVTSPTLVLASPAD